MLKQKIEYLPIIYLLKKNDIYYELKPKFLKLSLFIPSFNVYIYKYYLGTYYYIYLNDKFFKKIKEKNLIKKLNIK